MSRAKGLPDGALSGVMDSIEEKAQRVQSLSSFEDAYPLSTPVPQPEASRPDKVVPLPVGRNVPGDQPVSSAPAAQNTQEAPGQTDAEAMDASGDPDGWGDDFPTIGTHKLGIRPNREERSAAMQKVLSRPLFPKWVTREHLDSWRVRPALWVLKQISGVQPEYSTELVNLFSDLNVGKGGAKLYQKDINYVLLEIGALLLRPEGYKDIAELREALLKEVTALIERQGSTE